MPHDLKELAESTIHLMIFKRRTWKYWHRGTSTIRGIWRDRKTSIYYSNAPGFTSRKSALGSAVTGG